MPAPDQQQQRHQGGGGQRAEAPSPAVDGEPHAQRHQHERRRRQHRLRVEVGREQRGDDVHEHAHRQGDQEKDEYVEQRLGARSDETLRDLADGHAAGAYGDGQRAEILDRADEDGAEDDPQQGRQPAPDDGNCRPEHRRQSGYGGELVAEEHIAVRGDVVVVVAEHVRRRGPRVVEPEQPLRQMPGVEAVRQPVGGERQQGDRDRRDTGG